MVKTMLYYAALTTANGEYIQGIYTPEELHALQFCPETETRYLTAFKASNKDEARDVAQSVYYMDAETANNGGELLSWNEWNIIYHHMERLAHRFGLVREFRENGII